MKRIVTLDPSKLRFQLGGGMVSSVGAGLFLSSVWILAAVLLGRLATDRATSLVLGGLASLLGLGGLCLIFGRYKVDVDRRTRTIRRSWSIIVRLKTVEWPFDRFDKVALNVKARRGTHTSAIEYRAGLEQESGARWCLGRTRSYEEAWINAKRWAKFLAFPLVDRSRGEEIVWDPNHLEESLRTQDQREGKRLEDVRSPPAKSLARFEIVGHTIRFLIPPAGFTWRALIPLLAMALDGVAFHFLGQAFFARARHNLALFMLFAFFFGLLPMTYLLRIFLTAVFSSWVVEADRLFLRISNWLLLRRKTVKVTSYSLKDISIARPPGRHGWIGALLERGLPITVQSGGRIYSFGSHLPQEEKEWIVDVLRKVLPA